MPHITYDIRRDGYIVSHVPRAYDIDITDMTFNALAIKYNDEVWGIPCRSTPSDCLEKAIEAYDSAIRAFYARRGYSQD